MVTFCLTSCDLHPCCFYFFFYCSWFELFRPFIRHPFVCLHASPCLNFLFFPQYFFFRHSLSQPPLLSPLHLPCPLLEVALPLHSLPPFPIPLLPPPRSPITRRLGRPKWDYCLPCWRTRPGGFTRRRPSFSSASPWVSGACDVGWAHTPESKSFRNFFLSLFNPSLSHIHSPLLHLACWQTSANWEWVRACQSSCLCVTSDPPCFFSVFVGTIDLHF